MTSLLTSPPIPEIGEKAHDSGIVVEADLDSNYSQYANDDDDDESKKLRQSLLGSLRSQSFQIGSALRSSSVGSVGKAYPTSASSVRLLLLISLSFNLLFILWASNRNFLSGMSYIATQSGCQKIDAQSQLKSCDIDDRRRQQLCGVGMMQHMWPLFLSHQIASWLQWTKETRGKFNFLIVDDGSRPGLKAADAINDPRLRSKIMESKMDIEIYEVREDICWNIAGARNLAVFMAKTEYVYLGDADTIVEDGAAKYMLEIKYEDEIAFRSSQGRSLYYQFDRIRSDGKTRKPHPALMVLSKSTYWTAGGGDEDGMFTSGKFRQRAEWTGINIAKIDGQMAEKMIPPLQELGDAIPCPDFNEKNCNALVRFKKDNTLPRPVKPDQEEYWKMKFKGQKPFSNE